MVESITPNIEMKTCPFCGMMFSKMDFPHSFNRMITCDSLDCRKKRRHERIRNRK